MNVGIGELVIDSPILQFTNRGGFAPRAVLMNRVFAKIVFVAGTILVVLGYDILPWMTGLGVGLIVISGFLWWKV